MQISDVACLCSRDAAYVRITTSDGAVGWGESTGFFNRAVAGMVEELAPYLVGEDPRRIEQLWQELFRRPFDRGGPVMGSAIAGIDIALWDLKGKALGAPVYELLGGLARDRVRVYGHVVGQDADEMVAGARRLTDQGITAIRYRGFHDTDALALHDHRSAVRQQVEFTAALRAAVGPDVDLILECHGRYDPDVAVQLAQKLLPYDVLYLEDPVRHENPQALRQLRAQTTIPIATGERMHHKWDYRELVVDGLADYLRPDICWAGGITEMRKIAAFAEVYFVNLVPHSIQGPLGSAASLHAALAISNVALMEQKFAGQSKPPSEFGPWPEIVDGYALPPSGVGLGVEFDPEQLADPLEPGGYPRLRAYDGSVRDW